LQYTLLHCFFLSGETGETSSPKIWMCASKNGNKQRWNEATMEDITDNMQSSGICLKMLNLASATIKCQSIERAIFRQSRLTRSRG